MDTEQRLILSRVNNWTDTFRDLDKNGNYTVEEIDNGMGGYVLSAIEGDADTGYKLINVHVPESIDISGEKQWDTCVCVTMILRGTK